MPHKRKLTLNIKCVCYIILFLKLEEVQKIFLILCQKDVLTCSIYLLVYVYVYVFLYFSREIGHSFATFADEFNELQTTLRMLRSIADDFQRDRQDLMWWTEEHSSFVIFRRVTSRLDSNTYAI